MTTLADDRRLIEDYLPLDRSTRLHRGEKLHPRRYVERVHYWPARRPITAVCAAVYAALVPAPSSKREREEFEPAWTRPGWRTVFWSHFASWGC